MTNLEGHCSIINKNIITRLLESLIQAKQFINIIL